MEASSSSSSSSKSSSAGSSRQDKIAEFCSITGSSADVAESLLDACNGSLEMAVNIHMEGVPETAAVAGSSTSSSSSSSSRRAAGAASASAAGVAAADLDDDEDGVRAPIPQRQETLVGAGFEGYALRNSNPHKNRIKTVFDGFRNFGSESDHDRSLPVQRGKKRTLEELFKPPLDIMYKGDWQSAREKAESAKKWLLVNIQDAGEFQCQILNRDVWSSEAVKTILREHFIFWQQYQESENAQRYMTFYPVSDWPHVSILDPRTGEQVVTWSKITDSSCFCELVADFLTHNSALNESTSNGPPSKMNKMDKTILDADEEDQLAAAIQASLADSTPSSSNNCHATSKGEGAGSEADDNSDVSEFEPSGDDSNFSMPTPVKNRSKTNSRVPSPDIEEPKSLEEEAGEDWKKYLGDEEETSSILIRFPDGKRESKNIPGSSKFKAIVLFVVSRGFPLEKFEIVTNFPRRILTDMDHTKTLRDLGLFPQETVFVQQRS